MQRILNKSSLQSLKRFYGSSSQPPKLNTSGNLKEKVMLVSGGSRGIGFSIAKRAAQDGAYVVLIAKTVDGPGNIYEAADEIRDMGGRALPLKVDIRDEDKLRDAVDEVVSTYGGLDIVINNAAVMQIGKVLDLSVDQYDLMNSVNTRGTFLLSKYAAPFLGGAKNPHILNIAPPINLDPKWFQDHCGYTISKYGMSMCVLGMSEEFKELRIAVNALWPKTLIATAATLNLLGKNQSLSKSRHEEIMAEAAHIILTNSSKSVTGQFFLDEDVLKSVGQNDFSKFKVSQSTKDQDLMLNMFIERRDK